MATIIDSLLVTLGLDASDYKKTEAETAKATENTGAKITAAQKKQDAQRARIDKEQAQRAKQNTEYQKKLADTTVKGFKDMAIGAAGFVLGFESIKGFINLLGNLNTGEANLGRLGVLLGTGAHELNTWGIAASYVGGKAEDIQAAFANVSKSITDLNVNAQVSPLFLLAQRLGLDIRNVTDKTKFLLDLGDKLREYGQKFGMQNAFNISGLDQTTFNLITANNARALLAQAEKQNAVTEATAKAAEKSQANFNEAKNIGKKLVQDIGHKILPGGSDFALAATRSADNQIRAVGNLLTGDFATAWRQIKESAGINDADNVADKNTSRGIANNNPGNIKAVGNQKRDDKGFRIFGSIYEGLSAMDSQLDRYNNEGINTIRGIVNKYAPASDKNDVEKYMKALEKATGRGRDEVLGKSDRPALLRGMQHMETGRSAKATTALNQAYPVAATPGLSRVAPGAKGGATSNQTNVTIGEVKVTTAATDAQGMAAGAAAALRRQTYTAQANTGMTQ